MSDFWMATGGWWAHAAIAGGLVLLIGWLGLRKTAGPARRQRVGAWSVRGAVLAAGLCALPPWLLLPAPDWAVEPAARQTATTSSRPFGPDGPPQPPIADPVVVVPAERPAKKGQNAFGPDVFPFREDRTSEWVMLPAEPKEPADASGAGRPQPFLLEPIEPALGLAAAESDPITAVPPPPTVLERVVPVFMLGYLSVAGVMLLQLALGHAVLARLTWTASPLTGKARWVYDRLTEAAGMRPRAFVSDRIPTPICFGFFRPTILLPRRLAESVGENELRWVLAHELDHVQRGDHRSAYWVGLARAVFFFVPWFWPLRKELGLSQEYLADAAAAGAGGQPVDYAAFLVDLSGTPLERRLARPSLASTGVRAGKSDLFRRVNMLLNWGSKLERRVPRGFAVVAAGGLLTTAVGLSGLGFAADPPKGDEKKDVEVRAADADDPPAPPAPPAKPAKPADVKGLKAKIEAALRAGKVDEARALLNKLEAAVEPPAPPAAPRVFVRPQAVQVPNTPARPSPIGPRGVVVPPAPPAPPVVVTQAPRRGDWQVPGLAPVGGQQNLNVDLRKQYEKQLKEFEKAIEEAADDAAREQLGKARDEYKKAMEEAVKEADQARDEMKKGLELNRQGLEMNRQGRDKMRDLIEMQRRLQENLMKRLPQQFDRFQFDRLQNLEQLDQDLQQMLQGLQGFQGLPGQGGAFVFDGNQFMPFGMAQGGNAAQPRLGVRVDKVPAVLLEQLDLPKDSGVVVVNVVDGSAADKAGLKPNDILLELDGQEVPTDPTAFTALVGKVKGGEKVDLVVLRKGKRQEIKGVVMPEEPKPAARGFGGGAGGFNPFAGAGDFNQMQVQINNDDVTLNATQDGVSYAITGKIEAGKLTPNKITVTEGKDAKSYESLDEVPEAHRGTVGKLIGRVRGVSR